MLNDETNACLSVSREHAAKCAKTVVEECDLALVHKHIMFSAFSLECPDRDVSLLPSAGIMPGSSMVVHIRVQASVPVVDFVFLFHSE